MKTFEFIQGTSPLILSMPHNGQRIPEAIRCKMTKSAQSVPDTDWFLDRLYDFAMDFNISVINPVYSRYVIDLNRDRKDKRLYTDQDETTLCPVTQFDGRPVYLPACEPDLDEIRERTTLYWVPYHDQLQQQMTRNVHKHGLSILFEAHSIRSLVPRFFDGQLPHLNMGTNDGESCASGLEEALWSVDTDPYRKVKNGRFKGGFITRHYGQPEKNHHTVQLEIAQRSYMDESLNVYEADKAVQLQRVLKQYFTAIMDWAENEKGKSGV